MSNVLLDIDHVGFNINNKVIIDNVSLQVNEGDFIVLLGVNGSGKSTLLKLIKGLYAPTSGSICLKGSNINTYARSLYAKKVLSVSQQAGLNLFMELTVYENARLYGSHQSDTKNKKDTIDILRAYLNDFNPKLSTHIDQPVGLLSGGEQQVLVLALCLRLQPDLLLLDEHTSALDPNTGVQIMQQTQAAIKRHNTTCIMTTHNLDLINGVGNRLMALKNGKLVYHCKQERREMIDADRLLELCY